MAGACTRVLLVIAASWSGAALPAAQDQEISGRVTDERGQPLAAAEVTFLPLPVQARPRAGSKGRYHVAQAAHRAATKLPRTRTDRTGAFRCLLSPQLAALAAGSGVELAMRVQADGHEVWMQAIGDRLENADGTVAALPKFAGGPRLRLRIATAVEGSFRGFALIERAYRARPDRSVWLQRLVPVSATGEVTYDEPCRVAGEVAASLPTARAEGYRVTLYVAGLDRWQRTLVEGEHEVRPARSDHPPRRVLADRSEPARIPIEATYDLAGEEVTLQLQEPRVPLLGGEAPSRVRSASGPVAVDAWDPDVPLFVDAEADASATAPAPAVPAAGARSLDLEITDRRGQPLFGAAVWVEDSVARGMLPDGKPFAVSDPSGIARLAGLPPGMHWALVRHPAASEREVLLDTAQPSPVAVTLRAPPPEVSAPVETQPAMLLVDLEQAAGPEDQVDVGVLQPGGRLLRRGFPEPLRRVRLEGLMPGPATVWARVNDGPVHFVGGALASESQEPAVHPLRAAERVFILEVRDHEGKIAEGAYVSLGEATPKNKKPFTADLLPVTFDKEAGRVQLTVRLLGDLWVVVHGTEGQRRDVLLQSDGGPPIVTVALPPPPPPPPPKAKADEVEGEGKKD